MQPVSSEVSFKFVGRKEKSPEEGERRAKTVERVKRMKMSDYKKLNKLEP